MLKSSCCNHTYLGIREELFKQALAERVLENGQRVPCLSCGTLYLIENFALQEIGHLSHEMRSFLIKEAAEELLRRLSSKPKEKTEDEELAEIFREFKLPEA